MNNKKHGISILGICLLVLGSLLILYGTYYIWYTPNVLTYITEGFRISDGLQAANRLNSSMDDVIEALTISGKAQKLMIPGNREDIAVTVYATDRQFFDVCHETLIHGRLISNSDIRKESKVAVIDQDLANKIHTGGNAIGKTILIDHSEWEIIGIVDSQTKLGEATDNIVYVPLSSAMIANLPIQTVEIRIVCEAGLLKHALIQNALQALLPGGEFMQLELEKQYALLPLRWGVLLCSLRSYGRLIKKCNQWLRTQIVCFQSKLQSHYPGQLAAWIIKKSLFLLFGFAWITVYSILIMHFSMDSIRILSDWIPGNMVSITSFLDKFWDNLQKSSCSVQYFSWEKYSIQFSQRFVTWGSLFFLGGVHILNQKRRQN